MATHELKTVLTTRDPLHAEMIRMLLKEQGILCEVANEHQAGLTGVLEIKVNVKMEDEERAKQTIVDIETSRPDDTLVVIGFDDMTTADEVQLELKKLERSHLIDIRDSVVIVRGISGEISIKQTHHLTRDGALAGGLCGALMGVVCMSPVIGAVSGAAAGGAIGKALGDIGIDDGFLQDVGATLKASSSALAVLVRHVEPGKVLAELQNFKGNVLHTTLDHSDEERLRMALRNDSN